MLYFNTNVGATLVGKNPLSPRPGLIPDRSSPSRVRFAASRPGLLRADSKRWLFMKERGVRAVWTGRGCQVHGPALSGLVEGALLSFAISTRGQARNLGDELPRAFKTLHRCVHVYDASVLLDEISLPVAKW